MKFMGGLWVPPPLPVDEENWDYFWVYSGDAKIIGVVRTAENAWMIYGYFAKAGGHGAGQHLLAQGEAEIIARGDETLHLLVVQSNAPVGEDFQSRR